MNYVNAFGVGRSLGVALLVCVGAQGCEGTQREYARAESSSSSDGRAGQGSSGSARGNGAVGESGSDSSTIVTQLQPVPGTAEQDAAADVEESVCVESSTETCGPAREEGICKFGTRVCTAGAWGECQGAVFAGSRDCGSVEDNDCDGQPDDTLDDVCRCPLDGARACEEHEGLDGRGQCRAGEQACIVGEGNRTSDWGPCGGAVGPASADSCSVAGDDANCDGAPNGGCACVEGAMQPCGPDRDVGICQRGVSTCTNGAFSACQGAVFSRQRDCSSAQDNDCDGRPDNNIDATCTCRIGDVQECGTHPGRDGVGPCRAGQQTCEPGTQNATSRFGTCVGSVGPAQRDSCTVLGDDSDCSGSANTACQCVAGRGNAPCSGDANNSRCSPQGTCAPCQANADCSLVSGGRSVCSGGGCVPPVPVVVVANWLINGARSATNPLEVTSTALGITGISLAKAPAFGAQPALQNLFGVLSWPTTTPVDLSKYLEFGISTDPGRSVSCDHLEFSISANNADDSSANWQIRSSADNFAAVVASGSVATTATPGTRINANIQSIGTRSGIVTFRFYLFNIQGAGGPLGFHGVAGGGAGLLIFGTVL